MERVSNSSKTCWNCRINIRRGSPSAQRVLVGQPLVCSISKPLLVGTIVVCKQKEKSILTDTSCHSLLRVKLLPFNYIIHQANSLPAWWSFPLFFFVNMTCIFSTNILSIVSSGAVCSAVITWCSSSHPKEIPGLNSRWGTFYFYVICLQKRNSPETQTSWV